MGFVAQKPEEIKHLVLFLRDLYIKGQSSYELNGVPVNKEAFRDAGLDFFDALKAWVDIIWTEIIEHNFKFDIDTALENLSWILSTEGKMLVKDSEVVYSFKARPSALSSQIASSLAYFCSKNIAKFGLWDPAEKNLSVTEVDVFCSTIFGANLCLAGCIKGQEPAVKTNLTIPSSMALGAEDSKIDSIAKAAEEVKAAVEKEKGTEDDSAKDAEKAPKRRVVTGRRYDKDGRELDVVDTATGGRYRSVTKRDADAEPKSDWKKRELLSKARGLVSTEREYIGDLYTVQGINGGDETGTMTAVVWSTAHIKPFGGEKYSTAPDVNKIFISSGHAYSDLKIYVKSAEEADNLLRFLQKDETVREGLVHDLRVVRVKRLDSHGYFEFKTNFGEVFCAAHKLNEELIEDLMKSDENFFIDDFKTDGIFNFDNISEAIHDFNAEL